MKNLFLFLFLILYSLTILLSVSGSSFTLVNRCDYTVWPGILANSGSSPLDSTGFELPSGGSRSFPSPPNWSGRFWGRTTCTFDPTSGQGSCVTGDCGSNQIECNGAGAIPPATLAEFTVSTATQDFYDVSLVDGYNIPMIIEASGGSGNCLTTGCITDLNRNCPSELRSGSGEACKSACEAFGTPEYCCSGVYATPDTCKPSVYSEMFKAACPRSYSYAYDDPTSTFTCAGADYTITFCPSTTSRKAATDTSSTTNGSGSGEVPIGVNTAATTTTTTTTTGGDGGGGGSSWMPDFSIGGDSTKTIPSLSCALCFLVLSLFL